MEQIIRTTSTQTENDLPGTPRPLTCGDDELKRELHVYLDMDEDLWVRFKTALAKKGFRGISDFLRRSVEELLEEP
jgi:hypothetical protein